MSAPLSLIVFDVDGTLIDSQGAILDAMGAAFAAEGRAAPPAAETVAIVGLSLEVGIARLAPEVEATVVDRLAAAYRARFLAIRAETGGEAAMPLYPGARQALERLSRRPETLLGIATGKARRGLDHALAAHGLAGLFQTLQTADRHPSKPHPAMLHAALEETGVAPAAAVMVGDSEYDMAMAKAAGVAAVGVAWGYQPEARLRAAGADAVIHGFDALDGALARLLPALAA